VQQILPGVTIAETSALARALLADEGRVVLATAPQKAGVSIPSDGDLRTALIAADRVAVTAWKDATSTRALIERHHHDERVRLRGARWPGSV
jgi:hypothetical protein